MTLCNIISQDGIFDVILEYNMQLIVSKKIDFDYCMQFSVNFPGSFQGERVLHGLLIFMALLKAHVS